MSSPDVSQIPVITTAPDDVFYILKSVISRMISTGSVLVVGQTLERLREVVDKDYIGIIKKKLDDVYRNQNAPGSNARVDKIERENRMSFTVRSLGLSYGYNLTREQILLNDLDISASHLERLTRDLAEGTIISQNFTNAEEKVVKSHIIGFQSIESKLKSTLRVGIVLLLHEDNLLPMPRLGSNNNSTNYCVPDCEISYRISITTCHTSWTKKAIQQQNIKILYGNDL